MEDSGESILFCEKNPHPEEKQLEEPNPSTLFFSLACIINKIFLRRYAHCVSIRQPGKTYKQNTKNEKALTSGLYYITSLRRSASPREFAAFPGGLPSA